MSGFDVGRPEWDDQQEILDVTPHQARRPTFFTRNLASFSADYAIW